MGLFCRGEKRGDEFALFFFFFFLEVGECR